MKRKSRTSVGDGESKTSEPGGRIPDSGEGLAGGKEEIPGDGVGCDGKLEKDVSESMQVSEAGCAGNCFGKEGYFKQEESCEHECF
jgi:hypothetical protein